MRRAQFALADANKANCDRKSFSERLLFCVRRQRKQRAARKLFARMAFERHWLDRLFFKRGGAEETRGDAQRNFYWS